MAGNFFSPMTHFALRNSLRGISSKLLPEPPDEDEEYEKALRGADPRNFYQPDTEAMSQYLSTAQQLPKREDYQPSRLRRIGAVIAGFGAGSSAASRDAGGSPIGYRGDPSAAYKTARGIIEAPYGEAVEDWSKRLEPLKAGALMEEQGNRNARIYAEQTSQRLINSAREKRLTREGVAKQKVAEDKVKIAQQRAEAYQMKSSYHGKQFQTNKDGYIIAVGQDGKAEYVTMPDGSPATSTKLSDEQKILLGIQGQMDVAGVKGVIAGQNIAQKGAEDRATKQTPGVVPDKPDTEQEATYTDETGKVIGTRKTTTRTKPPVKPSPPGAVGPKPPGAVQMRGPKGEGPYWIPADKVEESKKKYGMTVVPPAGQKGITGGTGPTGR